MNMNALLALTMLALSASAADTDTFAPVPSIFDANR